MKGSRREQLEKEIKKVMKKYNMKHWSVCGDYIDDDKSCFIGLSGEIKSHVDVYEISMNTARLYQFTRGQVMSGLEQVARK